MTHVVHPYGFRLGITTKWKSNWFAANKKDYQRYLKEDFYIRGFLEKKLYGMFVSDIVLERKDARLTVDITTLKPGLIIGREGDGVSKLIEDLKNHLMKRHKFDIGEVSVNVDECRYLETSAVLVANQLASQLKKRMPHRRMMKQMIDKVISNREVKGVKLSISGRLGGAEIARREELKAGNIPLQTLRSNISYASIPCVMPYGTLGVKVWIYLGEQSTN